ncbi:hypothetical protein [Dyadobacter jejuensis]|nr:hypothetical protein [Dyadobacter jejuensis]
MHTTLLRLLSIAYLLIPNVLFSYGWFRQPYAILLVVGYCFLLGREFIPHDSPKSYFKKREVLFLALFALVWTFFSGAGGFSDQKSDFFAHNAKFYDLYKNPWPTYFPEIGRFACYYFGYYLFPAFVAKLSGQLSPMVIYLWTALGFFLGLSWVYLLINRRKWALFALFWIRGLGFILYLFFRNTEWLSIPIYRPVINGLIQHSSYVPNQLIGTMILTGMLLDAVFVRKRIATMAFPITLNFIWAIFPSITLTLLYAGLCGYHYIGKRNYKELWSWTSIPNFLLPALLILPTLGYFLSANGSTIKGWIWSFDPPADALLYYVLGLGLDLLLYYYILQSLWERQRLLPVGFIKALFVLLVLLSTYRMGYHNDWFYRTQIPIFLILIIVLLRAFDTMLTHKSWPQSRLTLGVYALAVFMMILQMSSYVHQLKDNVLIKTLAPSLTTFKPMPYDRYPNVYQLMKDVYKDRGDAEQYLGNKGSFYEQHLAKTPINTKTCQSE